MQNQQQNNLENQSIRLDHNNYLKPICIPIKESFTTYKREFWVYPDWTFQEMDNALCANIAIDFNVEREMYCLIPYGQPESEYGRNIRCFPGVKLQDYWASVSEMGFYLKRS